MEGSEGFSRSMKVLYWDLKRIFSIYWRQETPDLKCGSQIDFSKKKPESRSGPHESGSTTVKKMYGTVTIFKLEPSLFSLASRNQAVLSQPTREEEGETPPPISKKNKQVFRFKVSVADLWNFGTDPDPRIHTLTNGSGCKPGSCYLRQ